MPHTCAAEGCNNPIFAKLFCKFHQHQRRWIGGDKYQDKSTPKAVHKPIRRRTKERTIDENLYAIQAKMFFQDAVNNGTNLCVFCGEKVTKFEGLHHWKGRRGAYLLIKQWWSIIHNECHLFYHRATVEQMKEKLWYNSYMSRLQQKSEQLYLKEINKAQKNILYRE